MSSGWVGAKEVSGIGKRMGT